MLFKGTYRQKWAKVRPKGHEMENMRYFYWENCIFIRCAHVRTFRKARSASKRFVSATKWRLETFVSNYLSEKETIKNDKSDPNIFKILISCTVEGIKLDNTSANLQFHILYETGALEVIPVSKYITVNIIILPTSLYSVFVSPD